MKKPALSPIISIIILVVITTALVMIVLSFGKDTTNKSLSKTNNFGNISASDAEHYIYPRELKEGTLMFNFNPPASIKDQNIIITHYKINSVIGMEPIKLENPILLSDNKVNIVNLNCLYEYSVKDKLELKLITDQNKYIEIKMHDPTMVCVSGGEGTEDDPKVICTAKDLDDIRENLEGYYVLGKDIDLGCYSRKSSEGWEPIVSSNPGVLKDYFSGFFDGQNYTISNLYINRPNEDYVGLFAKVDNPSMPNIWGDYPKLLKNINLKDANIIGKNNVGGLVGYNAGNIKNSCATGEVSGNYSVGGLVGQNIGYIEKSYATGDVRGKEMIGGLVGINAGAIENTYATGKVTGTEGVVGGLLGENDTGSVKNSYSTGEVSGDFDVGGLVGSVESNSYLFIENSYWEVNSPSQLNGVGYGSADGVIGLTTEEMKTQSTFEGWDFSTIWGISPNINNGYPHLRSNPPK